MAFRCGALSILSTSAAVLTGVFLAGAMVPALAADPTAVLTAAAPVMQAPTVQAPLSAEPAVARPVTDICDCPAALTAIDGDLSRTVQRLKSGQPLRVVAFGSSSTYGTGASTPDATYPRRLEVELSHMFPDTIVTVVNRGVPGEDGADMVRRFDADTIGEKPDLVIWQTGTNDIEKGVAVDDFLAQTRKGLETLRAAGIDVMLMEPQYYPKMVMRPAYIGYLAGIRALGHDMQVPVIRRFDIMLNWIQSGQFAYSTMLASDSFHMKDLGYGCIAKVVAGEIASAAGGRRDVPDVPQDSAPTQASVPATPIQATHAAAPTDHARLTTISQATTK